MLSLTSRQWREAKGGVCKSLSIAFAILPSIAGGLTLELEGKLEYGNTAAK
jgi:hypothetical protein